MILQDSHGDKTTPSKTDFGLWNQVAAFGDTERILWFWGSNVQRFLTKFFREVFGRSTSSMVLCISVLSFVMLCSSSCVALCCVALC